MPINVTITSVTANTPVEIYVCDSMSANCVYVATVMVFPYTFTVNDPTALSPYTIKIVDVAGCEEVVTMGVTPTPTPSFTPEITTSPTPTPTNTPTSTITQTPTQTPSVTPTLTPTVTPSSDPYPYFLAGYCYDGRMYAEGGSFSSNCTQVQNGLGSATRYKSNYPYSYLYSGLWSTVNMFIYDTVTASLLNSKPIADGCQYWETSSLGKVLAVDVCTTPGGCCPGTPPS